MSFATLDDIRSALLTAHEDVTAMAVMAVRGESVSCADILNSVAALQVASLALGEFARFRLRDSMGNSAISGDWVKALEDCHLRFIGCYDIDTDHDSALHDQESLDIILKARKCVWDTLCSDNVSIVDAAISEISRMCANPYLVQDKLARSIDRDRAIDFMELLIPVASDWSVEACDAFLDLTYDLSRRIRKW